MGKFLGAVSVHRAPMALPPHQPRRVDGGEKGVDTMKIRADRTACKGHGMCFIVDQEIVPLDDGFIAIEGDAEVPAGREANAVHGVDACPEMALEIVDD